MCEKMVINKVEKLVPNSHDKKNYVIHIRALGQALKHGLILEEVHPVIDLTKVHGWHLTPVLTELKTDAKNDMKSLCSVKLWKTLESIRISSS